MADPIGRCWSCGTRYAGCACGPRPDATKHDCIRCDSSIDVADPYCPACALLIRKSVLLAAIRKEGTLGVNVAEYLQLMEDK